MSFCFFAKLVLFSSNFFDLDANFFGIRSFLNFWERVSLSVGIFLQKIGTFLLLARRLLISKISALQLASFFTKNAHHRDHRSHLTGFCSFNRDFISIVVSLGAVLATLIRWGSVDELIVPNGFSNLRHLSTLDPVSPYPVSYSLSELSLES